MQDNQMPLHIGIIMDGNGRWAKKRGLDRKFGHREGVKAFQRIMEYCYELGIPYLTFYAFSTENWARPKDEVDSLMNLLRDYLKRNVHEAKQKVHMRFIGNRSVLAPDIRERMDEIERETARYTKMTVNLAINYGGRDELVRAVRKIAEQVKDGTLSPELVDEALIARQLDTAGQPDPDFILRPSGERRSSNFLPWQGAYAEMIYQDVLWPDYKPADLDLAIAEYRGRDRRFGGI